MHHSPTRLSDLDLVVDLMRELSRKTDPQEAAELYGSGLRKLNLVPNDRYLSLSRRELQSPQYRITRNTAWKEHPNPWKEKEKLPVLSGGLLADIMYSNQTVIITDLPSKVPPNDPASEALEGMKLLVAMPHFDDGEAINYGIVLSRTADNFPFDFVPMMIWQANLWGRATLNLVNRQKLQLANDAMDQELKVVADIQRSLLPRDLPPIRGADLAVHYQTSQRAGGDYYDFFPLPDDRWGILIADVSGHGTPAAVLMAITHAIAHTRPGIPIPPEDLLCFVNERLAMSYTSDNGNFVTAFYAIFDPHSRTLAYASAGHPPPRLIRQNKVLELDGESSLPLGIRPREAFHTHQMQLQPADRLVFYTDGIIETFNPANELFGMQRLDSVCLAQAQESPQQLLERLLASLAEFSGNAPVTDDRTILALSIS